MRFIHYLVILNLFQDLAFEIAASHKTPRKTWQAPRNDRIKASAINRTATIKTKVRPSYYLMNLREPALSTRHNEFPVATQHIHPPLLGPPRLNFSEFISLTDMESAEKGIFHSAVQ